MRTVLCVLLGAMLLPSPVSAVWRITGRIGGLIAAVDAQGSSVYVAVGSRVSVYDATDPAAPREIGSTTFFGDDVRDVLIRDSRAYIAAGTDGLYIVDIADPSAPRVIGHWDSPGTAEGLAADGSWIYVADGPFGLQVVDASDPAAPRPAGAAFDMDFAFAVALHDHYAFVAGADAGLLVADVAVPERPHERFALNTPGYARDLAIAGTMLYVADQWGGVRVVSIATPSSPREIAAIALPGWAFGVTASESTLHVASGAQGFHTFDVSDPSHPQNAGSYPMTMLTSWKVALSNARAFVGVRTDGVQIFDVTLPSAVRQIGRIAPLLRAGSVAVRGDVAYVSTAERDVRMIDIARPDRMRDLGAGLTVDGLMGPIVVIGEKHVYVAKNIQSQSSLDVYDVSDRDRPALVKSLPFLNFAQELIPRGSLLYAPDEYGIQVFDITDPASPSLKGMMKLEPDNPLTVAASSLALSEQYAFVSADDGLRVVDVSDPARMRVVGSWSGTAVSQLAYRDRYLYATTGAFGAALVVFDASDPRQPVRIGSVPLEGRSVGELLLDGPYAYVANGAAGVAVIDIRSAEHPVIVQTIEVPGFASQLALDRDRLLITASNGGLVIAEQTGQLPMAASVSPSRIRPSPLRRPAATAPAIPEPPPPSTRRPPAPLVANAGRSVIVTSAADSGAGTLRQALANHEAGDVITFDPAAFPPSAPATIQVLTMLPHLKRDGVVIDASNAGVILDGSRLSGQLESGLEIEEPSRGNIIRGLQIVNFPSCGIFVGGLGDNIIGGDRSRGRGPIGEGNLLSRNLKAGIQVGDPNGNRIVGNLIGTDITGRTALGGQTVGVNIFFNTGAPRSAGGDTVGGYEPWERNVIAGNQEAEVRLHFGGRHAVIGNYLGTDIEGNALGNAFRAIDIAGSSDNLITENVVVGNHAGQIIDRGACCNRIVRNWFGVTRDGRIITRNREENGIAVNESFNLIFGNVFGGIRFHSLFLTGQAGTVVETIIAGNTFLGGSPTEALSGVAIGADAASRMFVGGSSDTFHNSIRGGASGIVLRQGVGRTFVLGNFIGTDDGMLLPMESAIDTGPSASTFVHGNRIVNIAGTGVVVRAPTNRVRQNSIHGSRKGAIEVVAGTDVPAPPAIHEVTPAGVTGTACGGCTVEVFSDTGAQARWYEGTTVADAGGRFTLNRSIFRGGWITATATDGRGSTSVLSAAVAAPPPPPRRRPARR